MEVLTVKRRVGFIAAVIASLVAPYQIDGWQKTSLFISTAATLGAWLGTKMCD